MVDGCICAELGDGDKKNKEKQFVCKHVDHNSIEVLEIIIFVYIDGYSGLSSTLLRSFFSCLSFIKLEIMERELSG